MIADISVFAPDLIHQSVIYRSPKDRTLFSWLHSAPSVQIIDFSSENELRDRSEFSNFNYERIEILPTFEDEFITKVIASSSSQKVKASLHDLQSAMVKIYKSLATEFEEKWGHFFQILQHSDESKYLIICRRGIDRSGLATSMLLKVLGASSEEINLNYLHPQETYLPPRKIYLDSFFEEIVAHHETWDMFRKYSLKLNDNDVWNLKKKFCKVIINE